LKRRNTAFGFYRLGAALLFIYGLYDAYNGGHAWTGVLIGAAVVLFVLLLRMQARIASLLEFKQSIQKVLEDEIEFIKGNTIIFDGGPEFKERNHNYTGDLDVFGMHTLFQYLNRTSTYVGKKRLAFLVSNRLSNQEINSNQEAVKELTPESSWRIEFQARARIIGDKEDKYQSIINWSKTENVTPSIFSRIVLYLFPVLFALCFFSFIFTHSFLSLRLSAFVFVMNLGVLGFYFKRISAELLAFDKIKRTLEQYALLIQSIETKKFQSESLRKLQEELTHNEKSAGQSIKELASIIQNLDSVQNLVGASVFNGTVLFHVHCFFKLLKWKRAHAKEVEQWFEVLGKVEALNSLANFKFNNPAFCFPEISETEQLRFEEMGHPLISESKRICNDVSFDEQRFIVLTGSNMSGKSTFLRTIGINMVLANCGAPVCAKSAVLNPRDIHVAMRVDDSLADSQSYFFAEINRLKSLVESNNSKDSFIILDEILRGTNSDDKRNGTIKLLEKLHLMNSCGIIATHDLEVCKISDEHPSFFSNKCFEVEITNNELVFDYQLRAGICQNKSATFLMEKAGII
jgi:hypothetical protein